MLKKSYCCSDFGTTVPGQPGQISTFRQQQMRDFGQIALALKPVLHRGLELHDGTAQPVSIWPSDTGTASSNRFALVKLRLEKESSHFKGQGSLLPSFSCSTRILRANMP